MLLLSPFLIIFMLVYLFLRHAEQFYNHPTTASSRRWSNLSRWMFREFNEVDHLFKHRINNSIVHSSDYLKQFPSPIISVIAKFISFISGGFAAVLIIIAFLDESLLEGHVFGRNLFWYAAVFGTITAISRAAVTDELVLLDPEREMSLTVQHTHHMPKRWRGKEHTETVRTEFQTLFQYTAMMWLEEMASIFLTPYLLLFVVPKRVDKILQFFADFTVNLEGVGDICSFSVFDFETHGNVKYGSPCNSDMAKRSSKGKLEKSFLSFQSSYLYWQPYPQGMQFLSNLKVFRDQQLQGSVTGNPQMSPQWTPSTRDQRTRNGRPPRDSRYHMGSKWLIETDHRSHPYLLDWYYTARPHRATSVSSVDVHRVSVDTVDDLPHQVGIWMPPSFDNNEEGLEGTVKWATTNDNLYGNRSSSHLGASTTTDRFFNEESTSRNPKRGQWWARNGLMGSHVTGMHVSFPEPPNFNRYSTEDLHGLHASHSNRTLEEEEEEDVGDEEDHEENQLLDWRNYNSLSRTTCPEDDKLVSGGNYKLHFDDIFKPPSERSLDPDVSRSV